MFPKLPIEIRFKIWRSAFPPPRCIDPDICKLYHTHKQAPPTALCLNRESRLETLRAYSVVYVNLQRDGPPRKFVIYLSPGRDTLLFSDLLPAVRPSLFKDILSQLDEQVEGGLASIDEVELKGLVWTSVFDNTKRVLWQRRFWQGVLSFNALKDTALPAFVGNDT